MSLLLDALKKAAQEKQKAKQEQEGASRADESAAGENNEQPGVERSAGASDTDKETVSSGSSPADTAEQPGASPGDDLELTIEDNTSDETTATETGSDSGPELTLDPAPELVLEKASATTSTVSDEALQLLVYKTNKQYRRKRKIFWGSILSGAALTLIIGGAGYYYAMLQEIESLERKHQLAMRTVESQPVTRPHILQSMQQAEEEKQEKDTSQAPAVAEKKPVTKPAAVAAKKTEARPTRSTQERLTIQVQEKQDPVGVLLERAWLAYTARDYATAEKAYREVLSREPKNRDALLGDAAVAMKKANYEKARAAYALLLKLDPRDPIATAGLASLQQAAPDTLDESKLKFMLQQQPDATHLHFALGNVYAKQKKWPQAQDEYFNAWQGDSNNADYAFNLAVSLDRIGKHDEARRFYESSLVNASGQNISFSVDAVRQRLDQLAKRLE